MNPRTSPADPSTMLRSIAEISPMVERRAWQLMRCIEQRQAAGDGCIDITRAFFHFSYDIGVRNARITLRESRC